LESFVYKGCETKEYVNYIDIFTKNWEWRQILSLLGHISYVTETKAKILGLSDELVNETKKAYFDYFNLIWQVVQMKKIDTPSDSRFSGSQVLKAVTEGKIAMEINVGVNLLARPRYIMTIILKPDSTPLIESSLVKQRKLRFREMIFAFLKAPGLKPWKFNKIVFDAYSPNTVELGVRKFEYEGKNMPPTRVYLMIASPSKTIPAPWEGPIY